MTLGTQCAIIQVVKGKKPLTDPSEHRPCCNMADNTAPKRCFVLSTNSRPDVADSAYTLKTENRNGAQCLNGQSATTMHRLNGRSVAGTASTVKRYGQRDDNPTRNGESLTDKTRLTNGWSLREKQVRGKMTSSGYAMRYRKQTNGAPPKGNNTT